MQFNNIAVVDKLSITEDAKQKIQTFSASPMTFPATDATTDEARIQRIGNADAVLGSWMTAINQTVLDACPHIRYIGICGTNLKNIDLDAAAARGITVKNVLDYSDEATAEYVFTQLFMLARGMGPYQWKSEPCELNGKTMGIIGLGAVGQETARLALGCNMKVVYNARSRHEDWERKGLVYASIPELLEQSDIVSLHVPKHTLVLTEKEFAHMARVSVLVETCLGTIFDMAAFKRWMKQGTHFAIFDHKLDIYDDVKDMERVIGANAGQAGITLESRQRLSNKVIGNIESYMQSHI